MTKLLYITMGFPLGDSETFIAPEICSISKHADQVVVCPVFPKQAVHKFRFPKNVETIAISTFGPLTLILGSAFAIANIFTLLSLVRFSGAQDLRNTLLNLSLIPKAFYVGYRLRAYEFDHIHAHWISSPATLAMLLSQIMGVGYSITAHRVDIDRNNQIGLKLRTAKFVRAIDERGRDQIRKLADHKLGRLVKIYLGTRFPDVGALASKGRKPLRGIIAARLVEKKGHKYLIGAIADSSFLQRNLILDIVGDGPLRIECEQIVSKKSISNVIKFLGTVDYEKIQSKLSEGYYDLAVLPSITSESGDKEGIPAFLMESMANGVPVVATLNGGADELLDFQNSVIVDEMSSDSLRLGLEKLVTQKELRSQLGVMSRETIAQEFNVERCVEALFREITQ